MKDKCAICRQMFDLSELYEYRGVIACEKHFDELQEKRNYQRAEIIEDNEHRTAPFKGIDTASNTTLGKANKELLSKQIDIAKKEPARLKNYEDGKL